MAGVHEAGGRIVSQLWHMGRLFIANPDLPHRFAKGLPLAPDDMAT